MAALTQTVCVQALPYEDPRIREFSDMYEIRGIPSLVIVGPDGRVITLEGRSRVSQDKGGYDFPWYPSSRRQQQCERALQAHLATVGTPLGSSVSRSSASLTACSAQEPYRSRVAVDDKQWLYREQRRRGCGWRRDRAHDPGA